MPSYTGTVSIGIHDYDIITPGSITTETETSIYASYSNASALYRNAYSKITTSGIEPEWIVNSATLYWYVAAYTKTKTIRAMYFISILDSGGAQTQVYSYDSATVPTVGWKSQSFIGDGLSKINSISAGTQTWFIFGVPTTAGATDFRTWTIGSYEGGKSSYLVIDYSLPSFGNPRRRVIAIE